MILDAVKKLDPDTALDLAARGLDAIGALANSATSRNAADIVMAIKHIYRAITDAAEARITVEEAHVEMAKLTDGLKSNDAVADAAVADKFDKE